LDVGRAKRLATIAQRNALRTMYRTCGYPGCTVPFDGCRMHHVEWWEHQGQTDLDNLIPLCEHEHHHLVHEGGWQLELSPDRTITVRRPNGTLYFEGSTVDRDGRAPPGTAVG
jgi:HNH endonuclease